MTRHRAGARVRRAGGGVPDLPRRGEGDRRPGGPQPRHRRRIAVPGRSGRGSDHCVRGARRHLPGSRAVRRSARSPSTIPRWARTRPRSRTTRCSSRSGSRCGTTAPAPTPRSNAGSGTGRSPRRARRSRWTAATIAAARLGLTAVNPDPAALRRSPTRCRQARHRGDVRRGRAERPRRPANRSTDMRGSADYKRHLASELTIRTLRTAVERVCATRRRRKEH